MPKGTGHSPRLAIVLALVSASSATGMVSVVHSLGKTFDWRLMGVVQALVALAITLPLALRTNRLRELLRVPASLWTRSFVGGVAFVGNFYAYTKLPPSEALVLINASPLWVAVLSSLVLGQRQRGSVWALIVLGLAGMVLIERPHVSQDHLAGAVAIVSGFLSAVGMMALARLRHIGSAVVVAHYSVTTLSTAALMWLTRGSTPLPTSHWSVTAVAAMTFAAALGVVAQLAATRAYKLGRPATVSGVGLSRVAMAVVLDVVVFSRHLDMLGLLGVTLVIAPSLFLLLVGKQETSLVERRNVAVAREPDAEWRARVADAVRAAELRTSCELQVHVDTGATVPDGRPADVFVRLGTTRTHLKNGLLLYLAPAAGTVALVADQGLVDIVPRRVLVSALDGLAARSAWLDAIPDTLFELGGRLGEYFPRADDDIDELPNEVTVGVI